MIRKFYDGEATKFGGGGNMAQILDLDDIRHSVQPIQNARGRFNREQVDRIVLEAMRQILELAAEKATADGTVDEDHNVVAWVNKQSITSVLDLVKR